MYMMVFRIIVLYSFYAVRTNTDGCTGSDCDALHAAAGEMQSGAVLQVRADRQLKCGMLHAYNLVIMYCICSTKF